MIVNRVFLIIPVGRVYRLRATATPARAHSITHGGTGRLVNIQTSAEAHS